MKFGNKRQFEILIKTSFQENVIENVVCKIYFVQASIFSIVYILFQKVVMYDWLPSWLNATIPEYDSKDGPNTPTGHNWN